jgi:glycosyltransferase involved in cell wall biosynthesis
MNRMAGLCVALVHYSAPPIVGGVESILGHHARLMSEAGHRVRLVAGRGQAWLDSVPLIHLPLLDSRHPRVLATKAGLDRGQVPPAFEGLTKEIYEALRRALDGVGVTVAHNVCSLHKNLALTAALHRLQRRGEAGRLIQWHHDLAWTTPRYQAEMHAGYPWDLLRTSWAAQHVAGSEARRQELAALMKIDARTIAVVPNGVHLPAFLKLEEQTQALVRELGLEQAAPLMLLPVRLTPRKNIELALRVLAALRNSFPGARLVVTGPPGPHNPANRAYLRQLVEMRAALGLEQAAHFLTEHTREDLPDPVIADFYRLADFLILPSREEGFGIPLIEAAVSRIPVFCSDIPPLRALGGDEVTTFDPDADPAAIAAQVVEHLRQSPVYRAAERARREHTWDRIYPTQIAPLLQA